MAIYQCKEQKSLGISFSSNRNSEGESHSAIAYPKIPDTSAQQLEVTCDLNLFVYIGVIVKFQRGQFLPMNIKSSIFTLEGANAREILLQM